MAESKFFDLVKCTSTTRGTGTLTLGLAVQGFLDFTRAGVADGDLVSYTIADGPAPQVGQIDASETGQGTANLLNGVWTLTRSVRKSTSNDAPIDCSGKQIVALTLAAEDLSALSNLAPVNEISGTFTADGALSPSIPAGAVLFGGMLTANADITVSLGTSAGGSNVLGLTAVTTGPGTPLNDTNFSEALFASDQALFVHSPDLPQSGVLITVSLWYLLPVTSAGAVSVVNGTFTADGQMSPDLPAGATVFAGRLKANTGTGVTVSLGTTSGASDILSATAVAGAPDPGVPLPSVNFTGSVFPAAQSVFVHSTAWLGGSVAVTLWYLLPVSAAGDVSSVGGTFTGNGSIDTPVPAGSVVFAGALIPGNAGNAIVELGTTSGASDILPATAVLGTPDPGVPLNGANFLESVFAADQTVFVSSPAWGGASVTAYLWYLVSSSAPAAQFLPLAGGVMTGPIVLSGDPTVALNPATKRYSDTGDAVNAAAAAAAQASATGAQTTANTALTNAGAAQGTANAATTTANAALPRSGGTMTGPLILAADPTALLGAATKQSVTTMISGTSVPLIGGSMSGLLILSGDPVANLGAATKQSVDAVATLVSSIVSGQTLKGVWNAATNTPTLTSSVGTQGDVWRVGVAGTTNLNGFNSWAQGDQAVFANGTWWLSPFNTAYGTMSVQNANNVAITAGTTTGQTKLGTSDGTYDQPLSPAIPGYAYAITDSQSPANLAFGITNELHPLGAGVAWINQGYFLNAQFVNPLDVPSLIVSGDEDAPLLTSLPISWNIGDEAGNLGMFWFSGKNTWYFLGDLFVSGAVSQGVSSAPAPSNSIDVTAPAYGAVGDMRKGYLYLTFSASDTTVTAYRYAGTVTLATGAASGTALVTLTGATADSGVAFQPDEVGEYIHVPGGGAGATDLVAQMIQYVDGQNMIVTAASITPLTNANLNLLWPCWRDTSAGKTIYIDGGYPRIYRAPITLARVVDTTLTYGQNAYMALISVVNAPNQITVSLAFPQASQAGTPYQVAWGTDDSTAVALAGQAAAAANARGLYFRGNGKKFLLKSLILGDAWVPSFNGQTSADPTIALNNTIWLGDNVETLTTDGGGQPYPRNVSPAGSSPPLPPLSGIVGWKQLPRLSSQSTYTFVITGDSLSTMDPQKQSPMWNRVALLMEYIRVQNPDKTINFILRGWGGATWSRLNYAGSIDSIAVNQGSSYYWMTDTTKNWLRDYVLPLAPDGVLIMMSQGNDDFQFHPLDVMSVINQIRAIPHGSGPPTDVVLMTDFIHAFGQKIVPGQATTFAGDEYGNGIIRALGKRLGFGVIEFASTQQQSTWGFDAIRRWERRLPTITVTGSPTAPIAWPCRVRDFGCNINLPGSTGAAAWAGGQHFDIQVSLHQENIFRIGCNAAGNLTVYAQSWGMRLSTNCTIGLGSTALTVAGPTTTFTGSIVLGGRTNYRYVVATPGSGSGPFSSSTDFQSVLIPNGGYNESLQRFFLREHASDQVCWMGDVPNNDIDVLGVNETITIGSHQFVPFDATAQSDVVFFFSDGTTFQTKIAAVTDAQHATLADPFPRDLSAGLILDVFVGRISIPETDTGIHVTGDTNSGAWIGVSFKADQVLIRYAVGLHSVTMNEVPLAYAGIIERYGVQFYPLITPAVSAALVLSRCWVDVPMPFAPSLTVWEARGIQDADADLAFGGSPAHPNSRWGEVVGRPVIAAQDFSA